MKTTNKSSVYTSQEVSFSIKSVRLSNWHIRHAKKLGDGSFTDGIRRAIEISHSRRGKH